MPEIRAVLFDAVGTLIYPRPAVAEAYQQVAARNGIDATRDEIERRFRAVFSAEEQFDAQQLRGRTNPERERQRWQRIVAAVFPQARHAEQLFDDLWLHFSSADHWALFDDVAPLVARLEQIRLSWGIASNFDERLHAICRGIPVLAACQHVFVSSELGARKPSREFARQIERRLGLDPEEILLVGDDVENDYLAARDASWQAMWIDRRTDGTLRDKRVPDSSRLSSLAQLRL